MCSPVGAGPKPPTARRPPSPLRGRANAPVGVLRTLDHAGHLRPVPAVPHDDLFTGSEFLVMRERTCAAPVIGVLDPGSVLGGQRRYRGDGYLAGTVGNHGSRAAPGMQHQQPVHGRREKQQSDDRDHEPDGGDGSAPFPLRVTPFIRLLRYLV